MDKLYGPNTVDKLYRPNTVDKLYGPNAVDKLYGPNTVDKLWISSCDLTKPLTLSFGLVSSKLFPLQHSPYYCRSSLDQYNKF